MPLYLLYSYFISLTLLQSINVGKQTVLNLCGAIVDMSLGCLDVHMMSFVVAGTVLFEEPVNYSCIQQEGMLTQ